MPDDLAVVRTLRADVPEMSDEAFTEGRVQLAAAMNPQEKQGVVSLPRRRPGQQPRRGRLLPVAAAAAVVVSAAVAVDQLGTTPGQLPPGVPSGVSLLMPPMPAQPTNAAGTLADKVAEIPQAPGQFLYIKTTYRHAVSQPSVTQQWVPEDRSEPWQLTYADGTEVHARGGAFASSGEDGWSEPSRSFIDQLPRDPAALYESLREYANRIEIGDPRTFAAVEAVGRLLGATVPADLRAALFRTLGYLPQIRLTPAVTMNGQPATAIRLEDSHGNRAHELFISQEGGGQLIGQRRTTIINGERPGRLDYASDIQYAVVDEMGQQPN